MKSTEDNCAAGLLQACIEAVEEGILVIGDDGRVLKSNQRFRQLWHIPDALLASGEDARLLDYVRAQLADPQGFLDEVIRLYGTDEVGRGIIDFKDGRVFERYTCAVATAQGRARLWSFRDVTERRKAESELRVLGAAIAQATEAVAIIDNDLVFRYVNPAFERLFGYSLAEIKGQTPGVLVPEGAQSAANTMVCGAFEGERLRRAKDGRLIPVFLKIAPIADAEDRPLGYVGTMTDMRAFKAVEARLVEEQSRLRGLYELSPLGIALTDMAGRYIEFNEAFRSICGYPEDELKTLDYWTLTPQEYAADEARQIELLTRTGRYGPYEKEYRRKDGSRVPISLNGMLVTGSDGQRYIWSIVEDISAWQAAAAALKESEARYRQFIDEAPLGIVITQNGVIRLANRALGEMVGYTPAELEGKPFAPYIHEQDRARVAELHGRRMRGETVPNYFECRIQIRSGAVCYWRVATRTIDWNGSAAMAVVSDITELKQAEEGRRLAASVFTSSQEGIVITDAEACIVDVNAAFSRITGFSRDEVVGMNPRMLKSGHQDRDYYAAMWTALRETGHWSGEVWNRRKDGKVYAELLTISAVPDDTGSVGHYVGVFADITPLKEHQRELERIAHFDALTGIPNRVLLGDRMQQAVAQTRRAEGLMAVCYLDLDGFKPVNDQFGHEAGDRLLVEVARRMKECVRGGDTVARIGGDEFVLLLLNLERIEECEAALERILVAVARPIPIDGRTVVVSASLGVTLFPLDDADADTLLRHADQAMYFAKQGGRNAYHFFDPAREQQARTYRDMLKHIEEGLARDEFALYYQPKIDMRQGRMIGVEALIRWHHPERGLLLPGEFLPFVEDTDLSVAIGDWVIARALAQLGAWQRAGLDFSVSINIAPRHLLSGGFVAGLRRHLEAHVDAPPQRLELEVLETAALEDCRHVAGIIQECCQLGVSFALDDFGTGYSSLTYLKTLPAQTLKIDQSFVRDMLTDANDLAIVEAVIGLAGVFQREVIAEGVETVEHGTLLLQLGCPCAQGFGIARPMLASAVAEWAGAWRPACAWSAAGDAR